MVVALVCCGEMAATLGDKEVTGSLMSERCIAGTGAAVSGDEARCAALEVVVALVVVVEQSS